MTTKPSNGSEVAGGRRGSPGISNWVLVAGSGTVVVAVVMTRLLSALSLPQDLGRMMSDAARGQMPIVRHVLRGLGLLATAVYDGVREVPVLAGAADFAAHAVVLAVFVALSAMLVKAFFFVQRQFFDEAPVADEGSVIRLPREAGGGARMGGWGMGALMLILVAALAWMPGLFDLIGGSNSDWQFYSLGFVEAGLVCAILFLAWDSWLDGPAATDAPAKAAERNRETKPKIDELKAKLREHLGASVLAEPEIKPPTKPAPEGNPVDLGPASEAHAAKLATALAAEDRVVWRNAVASFKRAKQNIIILEPLARLHFTFLVEAMSVVQDEGRCVLVVAPEASAERSRDALSEAFSIHCRDITQVMWDDVGDGSRRGKAKSTIETIVMVTDETLQERILGKDADVFTLMVERIGLIVVLDAHLFDLAQLRLQMAILLQQARASDLRVVAHAAPWRGMETELHKIFAATGHDQVRLRLVKARSKPIGGLVLRNDTVARDALLTGFLPAFGAEPGKNVTGRPRGEPARKELEPIPLLARIALRGGFDIGVWDIAVVDLGFGDGRRRWEQVGSRLVAADPGSDDTSHHLETVYETRTSQPDPDSRASLLLVQDRNNLVEVLSGLGLADGGVDRLAVIASEAYPMRDFMVGEIGGGPHNVGFDHDLMPMAPRPSDGLRELARLVLAKMTASDGRIDQTSGKPLRGISRSDAIALFDDLGEKRLLAAHRLSPTRLGLKRLLESQFGGTFEIRAVPTQVDAAPTPRLGGRAAVDDDIVYICANAAQRSTDTTGFLPLDGRGLYGGAPRYGWVAREDHGLAYVVGSTVLGQDEHVLVRTIDDAKVEVDPTNDPNSGNHGLNSGARTIFCRAYDLDVAAATTVATAPQRGNISRGECTVYYYRLYSPMRRLTHATITEESMTDGASGEAPAPGPLSKAASARRVRASSLAQVIRFERPPGSGGDNALMLSRIAFTLQATLADVLLSLFPNLAHRTAVVSPQATLAFHRLDAGGGNLERHLAGRYPRLATLDANAEFCAPTRPPEALSSDLERVFCQAWDGGQTIRPEREMIDILIVEDWSGDLGVCGAIDNARGRVQKVWLSYLRWLVANKERPDLFQRFGTQALSDEFVFDQACELLAAVS